MREIITSTSNKIVKMVRSLKEKKFRDKTGLFLAEGMNLVKDIPSGMDVEFYVVSESRADEIDNIGLSSSAKLYYVSDSVMKSLSATVTPIGLLAVVRIPTPEFSFPRNKAIILDGVSDPGNVGGIIRTAAATGFEDVYLLDCADPYSPKAVRGSMSGIFRTRIFKTNEDQALAILKETNSVALDMDGEDITKDKICAPVTLVAGSEAHGVRELFKKESKKIGSLPMQSGMESLNVAVAASVAMYYVK